MEQMNREEVLKLWRQVIVFFILFLLLWLTLAVNAVLRENDVVYPFGIAGFDVDSEDRVYLAKWNHIEVYEGQKRIRRMTVSHDSLNFRYSDDSRTKNYFMIRDDLLYVASTEREDQAVICYDLDGNFIATATDLEFQTVKDYSLQKSKVHGNDEYSITNVYRASEGYMEPNIVRYKICKNDKTLCRMRLADYFSCDGWMALCGITAMVIGFLGYKRQNLAEKNNVKEYKFSKEELFPKLYSLFHRITKKDEGR